MALFYEPRDLPRLRDQLVEFSKTDVAHQMSVLDEREGRVRPRSPDSARIAQLMRQAAALEGAELFYVAPEMCELAEAAARSLPEFELTAQDPPSRVGLVWLPRPVIDRDNEQVQIEVIGMTWSVLERDIRIAMLVDRDATIFKFKEPVWGKDALVRLGFPPAFPMGHWDAPLLPEEDGVPPLVFNNEGLPGHHVLATLKTLWLLLRQPMTVQTSAPADRAERRRCAREGREPAQVRVIHLRRPPGRGTGQPGEPTVWHHRWIVRGHWRMQAYGEGRQLRRPVWISPFVKGPEDAPMIGGEKVYVLDQPPV